LICLEVIFFNISSPICYCEFYIYFLFIACIDEDLNEYKSSAVSEETNKDNTEQLEADNQKRMFLISIEEEKQKQEKMLAIESDVKNVEKDIQGIQDLFRDLSKLVNVCIRIKLTFNLLLFINCALCYKFILIIVYY